MTNSDKEEESLEKETDPALPTAKPEESGDQITKVIGNVGRWQLEKILLVFLASAPGKHFSLHQSIQYEIKMLCLMINKYENKIIRRTGSHLPRQLHNSQAEVLVQRGGGGGGECPPALDRGVQQHPDRDLAWSHLSPLTVLLTNLLRSTH